MTATVRESTVARVVFLHINGHPFGECNHRTAAAYLLILTRRLGKRPAVSGTELAEFLRRIDREQLTFQVVERWVRDSFTG